MDLVQLGTQLLSDKLGLQLDPDTVSSALTGLLGGSGGSLLDSVGGLGGLMGAAKSFL